MKLEELQDTLKNILAKVAHPRVGTIFGLQEAIGKLAKNVMDIEIYNHAPDLKNMEDNTADVLFATIDVCNAYGLNLNNIASEKLQAVLSKISLWEKVHGEELKLKRQLFDL